MMLLPPGPGVCPICATDHKPKNPHNQQSLYYQYRFYEKAGRWPTWADAIAHCDESMKEFWKSALIDKGAWSEPDGEPIADPPHDSINQPVGDINDPSFGPQ